MKTNEVKLNIKCNCKILICFKFATKVIQLHCKSVEYPPNWLFRPWAGRNTRMLKTSQRRQTQSDDSRRDGGWRRWMHWWTLTLTWQFNWGGTASSFRFSSYVLTSTRMADKERTSEREDMPLPWTGGGLGRAQNMQISLRSLLVKDDRRCPSEQDHRAGAPFPRLPSCFPWEAVD